MAAKVLHIEIGDRITKVCRPYKKGKVLHLADHFVFQTPETFVSDGLIMEPEALGQVIKEQLTAHALDHIHDVVLTVSSGKIATREVKLPPVKEKQLDAIVKTNAPEYFPVDLQDYHVAYSMLGTVMDAEEPYTRVLVMAAPLRLLDGYFKTAEAAELNVSAIDTAGNAHYQLVRGVNGKGETAIFVNVDCTSSDISFMHGDTLLLQRTFSYGGDEMIVHYLSAANRPMTDYLTAAAELDVRAPAYAGGGEIHTSDVQMDLNRLIGSIGRSVDYYSSNKYGDPPEKIVLMGPCRHLAGLCELVAENTTLETIYLDELPAFQALIPNAPEAPSYTGCLGSLFRPLDMMPQALLPKSKAYKKENESLKSGIIIGAVLAFAGLALGAFAVFSCLTAQAQLADLNRQIDSLAYTEEVHDTYLAFQAGQQKLEILGSESALPNSRLVQFCEELEKKMPSSILLLSAACSNDGVSMNITVSTYEDAATVISNLRTFESLSTVDVASVSRTVNEAGIARVAFALNCTYGLNPYINDINPYLNVISDALGQDAPEEELTLREQHDAKVDSQLEAAEEG